MRAWCSLERRIQKINGKAASHQTFRPSVPLSIEQPPLR
jgi:hypothetical protein